MLQIQSIGQAYQGCANVLGLPVALARVDITRGGQAATGRLWSIQLHVHFRVK